jgi:hypothetical protein
MVYLPHDFVASQKVNASLGQIHMRGGFAGSAGGYKSFPPLLQMEAKGDHYKACFHVLTGDENNITDRCDYRVISPLSEMMGRWSRVTMHLDVRERKTSVKIFFNGKIAADFEQVLPRHPQRYYLKYGIYRSFVSRHGGPMPTQVVYYDEVKVGATREVVEDEKVVID